MHELATGLGTEIKFIDLTEKRALMIKTCQCTGAQGESKGALLFHGLRVSALQDENVLEIFAQQCD